MSAHGSARHGTRPRLAKEAVAPPPITAEPVARKRSRIAATPEDDSAPGKRHVRQTTKSSRAARAVPPPPGGGLPPPRNLINRFRWTVVPRGTESLHDVNQRESVEGPFAAGALRFGLENVPAGSPCNVGASDRPSRAGQPGLSQTQLDLDNIYFLASLPAFLMLQPLTFCFGRGAVAQDVFRFSVVFEEGEPKYCFSNSKLVLQSSRPAADTLDSSSSESGFSTCLGHLCDSGATSVAGGAPVYLVAPPPDPSGEGAFTRSNSVYAVDLATQILRNLLNNRTGLMEPGFRQGDSIADGDGWNLFKAGYNKISGVSCLPGAACKAFAEHFEALLDPGADPNVVKGHFEEPPAWMEDAGSVGNVLTVLRACRVAISLRTRRDALGTLAAPDELRAGADKVRSWLHFRNLDGAPPPSLQLFLWVAGVSSLVEAVEDGAGGLRWEPTATGLAMRGSTTDGACQQVEHLKAACGLRVTKFNNLGTTAIIGVNVRCGVSSAAMLRSVLAGAPCIGLTHLLWPFGSPPSAIDLKLYDSAMAHQMKCDALTGGTFAKVLHLGLTTGRLDVQAATHAAAKELESDEAALRELGGESTLRAEVGFNLYPSQYSNLRDGLMAVLLDARERTTAFFSEPTHFAVVDQRALSAILERRVKYRDELRQKILAKPDESMVMERLLLAVADWQMDHIVHPKPTDEGMAHWFQLVVRSLQHLRDPAVGFQNATYSRALEFFPGIPTCLLHNTCPPAVWALIAPMVARALGSGGRKGKGSYLAQFGHFVHMAKQGLVTAAVLDAFIDVLLVLMLYTPLEALAPNTIDKRRVDTDLLCLTIEVTGLSTAAPHVLLCTHLEGNTLPATQAAGQDADGGVRELVAQFRVLAEAVEHKGTISLGRDLHLKWTTRRRTRQPLDNLLMALAPLQVPASGQLDPAATDTQPTARQAHSPAALLAWALRGVIAAAMNTTLPNANASLVALLEARAKTHYRLPSLPVFVKATTHGVQHVGRVLQFASLDDVEASSEAAAAASDAVTAFCAAHLADLSRNQAFTSPESVLHAGATAGSNAARSALATGFAALTTLSPLFALQVTRVRRTRAQMAAAADHAVAGLAREDNGGADDGDSVVALERLAVAASVLQYEPRESVLWLITTSFTPTALAFIIANLSPALIRSYSNELQVPISPQFSDVQHLLLRIGVLYQKRLSSVEIVSNWLSEPECERVQRYLASEAATFRTTRSNFTGYTATMPLHHGIVDAAEALQYALDPGGDATAEAHRLQLRGAHQYLTGRSDSNLTFRHAITGFMAPLVAREPVQVTTAAVFRAAVRKTLEGLKNMTLDQLANLPPIVARWAGGPPGERLCDRLFVAVEQGLEESLNEHDYVHLVYIAAAQADFITPIGEPPVTLLTCVLQCSPSSVAEVHDFLRDVFPVGSEDTLQRLLQARPSPALELWRALSH